MEKVSLPIKTKISACLLLTGGLLEALRYFYVGITRGIEEMADIEYLIPFCSIIILTCIPGYLLFKRNRIGWFFGVAGLSLIILYVFFVSVLSLLSGSSDIFIFFEFIFPVDWPYHLKYLGLLSAVLFWLMIFSPLLPFILLLLDRKNFWTIAT